jgi:hypothetical protein
VLLLVVMFKHIGVTVQGYNANTVIDASYVHTDNNYTTTEKNKLAGIESGATADQTASEILTAITTVDGAGSGLDADLLDGQQGSYYQPASTALTTSTSFAGDVSGTYNAIVVADDSHNHIIANVDGLQTALDAKAPLASPALTGTPTAPTAAVGTNTTQVATTAFVNAEIANDAPTKTGTGASGTWGISITGNAATATSATTATNVSGGLNASNLTSGTVPDARISGSYTGMTNLTGSGTVDFAKFLGNAADTAAAPSYSWTGDTNTGIYQPSADQIGITTGGSERMRITSAGGISFGTSGTAYGSSGQVLQSNGNAAPTWVTPSTGITTTSGSANYYGARAWVNFNGTGTVAIRGSVNVSSITDNGTGDYTVTFTTAMANANYSAQCTAGTYGTFSGSNPEIYGKVSAFATGSVKANLRGGTGGAGDVDAVCVSIFD